MKPTYYLELAILYLGHYDKHTVTIARIVELWEKGLIERAEAVLACSSVYFRGVEGLYQPED